MGTLTYSDFENEINLALGNRDDASVASARITRILNLAQMRVARFRKWEELEGLETRQLAVTADAYADRLISMPDNIRDIYSIRVYDSTRTRKLQRIESRRLDMEEPANEYITRNIPNRYTRWSQQLELDIPPDDNYTLRARVSYWPTAFAGATSPTQTSDLNQKDDLLISLSVNWIYQSLGNYERSGRWWVTFSNMLESARFEENEKPDVDYTPSASSSPSVGDYWRNPFVQTSP